MATLDERPGSRVVGPAPSAPRIRTRVWHVVFTVLGAVAAAAIVWTKLAVSTEAWHLWGAVGTALGALAGFAFGSGVARYSDVTALHPVPRAKVVPHILLMALAAFAALPLAVVLVPEGIIWQGVAIPGLAIVGALPAGAAVAAIRVLAVGGVAGSIGHQLNVLLQTRRLLGRLTMLFASLVVGVTLLTAAGDAVPARLVIYTGTASALVVAMVYLPAAAVLRRRCQHFVDEAFTLDGVDRAHLIQAAEDRNRLEGLLGLHRTTIGGVQNGLAIISPLLASTGITLLPGF